MVITSLIQVLLIEDNLAEARLLQEVLKGATHHQFKLIHAQRLGEGLNRLEGDNFDIILLDLTLPDSQGLDSLAPLTEKVPHLPIVVLTNTNDEKLALEAVRQGAQDYLVKRHITLDILVRAICYAIERKQMAEQLREANQTLEKRVEQRTKQLIKAQELNQLKSEFVAMLSHDFRNPMNTILLSAGLLEDSSDQLTREQQLSYFQMIRTAIKEMDQLLSEILLLGKADSGKLQGYFLDLDLEEFCEILVKSFQLSANNNHQIIFTSQGKLDRGVWDEKLLRHILNNLLNNAIKYSPNGGQIEFDLIAQETEVIFKISDQGIGISPEAQKRLFQPFYRAENVDHIPGTGLGLAIVQKCVEAHGGTISVESKVRKGTTFTVILPILEEVTTKSKEVASRLAISKTSQTLEVTQGKMKSVEVTK